MVKHNIGQAILESMPDTAPEDRSDFVDADYFAGLCAREVDYLCCSIALDDFNRLLVGLHCLGFTDKEIAERLLRYLPHLCTETSVKPENIKERRRDIIRRIEAKHGEAVGLITVMRRAFRGDR